MRPSASRSWSSPRPPKTHPDLELQIIEHCRGALPGFMVPQRVIFADSLPRNPNGKIDRKLLATAPSRHRLRGAKLMADRPTHAVNDTFRFERGELIVGGIPVTPSGRPGGPHPLLRL